MHKYENESWREHAQVINALVNSKFLFFLYTYHHISIINHFLYSSLCSWSNKQFREWVPKCGQGPHGSVL